MPSSTGCRGVAVLAVVAAHTGAPVFTGGALAIDVFFVLSGFLITTLLVEEYDRSQEISLRQFYLRRSLRIFPALIAVLVFVTAAFAIFRPFKAGETLAGVPASLFHVSSWLRAFDVTQLGWLGHTWSLSVEEHYYIVWPLLVLVMCKYAWRDPLRSVRSVRESCCPVLGKEDNRSDGTACEAPAFAGADHQEVA